MGSYRDYRPQAIHVLSRLVTDEGQLVFQPLGSDLLVRGATGIVELQRVQVRIEGLPVEFLRRALLLAADRPAVSVVVFSQSPLPPELARGWMKAGPERQPLGWALRDAGFAPEESERLFERVRFVEEDAAELSRRMIEGLGEPAFELAAYALWLSSETGEAWTHQSLIDRLGAMKKYLQTSWQPLAMPVETPGEATADPALTRALAEADLAVLHGPGGRAIAQAWLASQVPAPLRLAVTPLPDPLEADAFAAQLATHVAGMGLPIHLALDVQPRHRGWPEVVDRLRRQPRLKIVVSVREDEWRHAGLRGPGFELRHLPLPGDERDPFEGRAAADLDDEDLAPYLHRAFERGAGIEALAGVTPRRWTGVAGVLRALLWLGVRDHVEVSAPLIEETRARFGGAWSLILDTNLGKVPGLTEDWANMPGLSDESRALIAGLRSRQAPAERVFEAARTWLSELTAPIAPPATNEAWRALAETRFWQGALAAGAPLPIEEVPLAAAIDTLPLETIGEMVVAFQPSLGFPAWLSQNRAHLLARYQRETGALAVEDDGQTLRAIYVAEAPDEDEALRRVWLLRMLFPDRQRYAAESRGHTGQAVRAAALAELPPPWQTELNDRFVQLADREARGATWQDYAESVLALRNTVLHRLKELTEALSVYFRKDKGVVLPGSHIEVEQWERSSLRTARPPLLPRAAVDPWGLAAEATTASGADRQPLLRRPRPLALAEHAPYLATATAFWAAVTAFQRQAVGVMAVHSLRKSRPAEVREAAEKLLHPEAAAQSIDQLATALQLLPRLQSEFRSRFGELAAAGELDLLERRERQAYTHAFLLWHRMALHPGQTLSSADVAATEGLADALKGARDTLRRHLRKLSVEGVSASILGGELRWQDEPAQWITFDVPSPAGLYAAFIAVRNALTAGIAEVGKSDLPRHAFQLFGRRVVVVGLIRGKALQRAAWVLSLEALTGGKAAEDVLWLHEIHRAATPADWAASGLQVWEADRLAWAERLQASVRALYAAVAHLAKLEGAPDGEVLRAHVAQRTRGLAKLVEQLTRDTSAILRFLEQVPVAERANRPALMAAAERLADFYQGSIATLLPDSGDPPTLAQLAAWTRHLESTIGETEIFRLLWAADVLEIPLA
jgi:hypothetical protein